MYTNFNHSSHTDSGDEALQEMNMLRERLPSGSVTLALRRYRGDEESEKQGRIMQLLKTKKV